MEFMTGGLKDVGRAVGGEEESVPRQFLEEVGEIAGECGVGEEFAGFLRRFLLLLLLE
jgi:hypothetical protein